MFELPEIEYRPSTKLQRLLARILGKNVGGCSCTKYWLNKYWVLKECKHRIEL